MGLNGASTRLGYGLWRRRGTLSKVLLSVAVAALVFALGNRLPECFSKVVSKRVPENPEQPGINGDAVATVPTAEAWLRAAKRTAEGREDSAAHWEVAWESTEAWWLRPVAHLVASLVCFGAILQQQRRFVFSINRPSTGSFFGNEDYLSRVRREKEERSLAKEAKAAKARQALQRMELPFFATSASWSDRPLTGVIVSGNLREGALQGWQQSDAILKERLEEALGQSVVLHLLRRDDKQSEELSRNQQFELLVTEPCATTEPANGLMLAVGTLIAAVCCSSQLGASTALQSLGAVIQPGASYPLAAVLCLMLLSEGARSAAARMHGVTMGPRAFLPSPQFGLLGTFSSPETPCPSRSSALSVALAAPLTLAACSVAFLVAGASGVGESLAPDLAGPALDLRFAATSAFWPMAALLPQHCSALSYAGAQGLLMACLALLPHSPDGKAACMCLLGRGKGEKLGEAAGYFYPFLGLVAMWCFGPGFMALPMTWSLLLTNVSPSAPPPPLEEASELSDVERMASQLLLLAAAFAALPLPLHLLPQLLGSS